MTLPNVPKVKVTGGVSFHSHVLARYKGKEFNKTAVASLSGPAVVRSSKMKVVSLYDVFGYDVITSAGDLMGMKDMVSADVAGF